jgi:hypothetical protein
MASDVLICRCPPARLIARAPVWVWLSLHVLLCLALYIGSVAVAAVVESNPSDALGQVLLYVGWGMPFHLCLIVVVVGQLALLRMLQDVRWYWFRLAALAVFVLPILLLLLVAWPSGNVYAPLVFLPMSVLMGLLVLQPDPSP